jgi:tRNA pseudouridine55 synthase
MTRRHGVLLVDKSPGPSSHDVVARARRRLRERAIGHCGTLDPAASGLLVLCVGKATRLSAYLTGVDKTYRAVIGLGMATDTGDATGRLTEQCAVEGRIVAAAASALTAMVGPCLLAPPVVSAINVDGRRAHARARAGEELELAPRPMELIAVSEVEVQAEGERAFVASTLAVRKGTYVRSLAVELGRRLGVPARVESLHRIACGALSVLDPRVVRIDADGSPDDLAMALLDPVPLLPFPSLAVPPELIERLRQGQRLSEREPALAPLLAGPADRAALRATDVGPDLVVVRVEPSERGGRRVSPERVVRLA